MFSTPLTPWWIGLPQVQAWGHCSSSLGRTCILPLSTLTLQCEGTFCATPQTDGESQGPTWGTHPETAPSLLSIPTLCKTSLFLPPILGPLCPIPYTLHNVMLTVWNNWRDNNNKDTSICNSENFTIVFRVILPRGADLQFSRITFLHHCL